jgi:hypothetical protein
VEESEPEQRVLTTADEIALLDDGAPAATPAGSDAGPGSDAEGPVSDEGPGPVGPADDEAPAAVDEDTVPAGDAPAAQADQPEQPEQPQPEQREQPDDADTASAPATAEPVAVGGSEPPAAPSAAVPDATVPSAEAPPVGDAAPVAAAAQAAETPPAVDIPPAAVADAAPAADAAAPEVPPVTDEASVPVAADDAPAEPAGVDAAPAPETPAAVSVAPDVPTAPATGEPVVDRDGPGPVSAGVAPSVPGSASAPETARETTTFPETAADTPTVPDTRDTTDAAPAAGAPDAVTGAAAAAPAERPAAAPAAGPSAVRPTPGPGPRPVPGPRPGPRPGQQAKPAAAAPPAEVLIEQAGDWGRIDDDGTVYVRTADGERAVGSWQAGSREAGLSFYYRKYDELATEVELLEKRLAADAGDAKSVASTAVRLRESLATANVVGDLGALDSRLATVIDTARERQAAHRAAVKEASAKALADKQALVEEAERLASSTEWKSTGDRFRALVDEWRGIKGGDRRLDNELWKRISTAREEFTRRRGTHFAAMDEQRKVASGKKEKLVKEAEALADSKDWGPAATRFKDLMVQWKAAGPAAKGAEDALWTRFRAAQDGFFARRSEVFAERDKEYEGNQQVKEKLLAEAEALDPSGDVDEATRKLRDIQERWEAAGKVPREAMGSLEKRMEAVEKRFREVSDKRWRQTDVQSSPLVVRLRESVGKLEKKLEKARAAGRDKDVAETEAALQTQREWLSQAEQG